MARAFEQLGAPAIRFQLPRRRHERGRHDEGRGEVEDALAVIAHGRARWPQAALWLGASPSAARWRHWRAAAPAAGTRLVLVAPASEIDVTQVAPPACPWLIVQGDADDVVPAPVVLG